MPEFIGDGTRLSNGFPAGCPRLMNPRGPVSEFAPEGAVLEGGEEGVQLGQGGAVGRFQGLHPCYPPGEFALQGEGGKWNRK